MFTFIWALFKDANLTTALGLGEQAMQRNDFSVLDPRAMTTSMFSA